MDRQRVFLIFGGALVAATLLTWFLYAKTQAPKQEARVTVLAAARDLAPGAMVRRVDLRPVRLLSRDVPKGALLYEKDALNRVALYPLVANEPLTAAKLSLPNSIEGIPSTIEPGYRAMAVPVSDVSGVAGLIQPGSRVDVLFTKPGSMAEAITSTILQNVKVMAIGRMTQPGQTADPNAKTATPRIPVATLIVTPEQAQKLELAKNQGKIALSLRNPTDHDISVQGGPITTEVLDPMISARIARARRGRTTNIAGRVNLEDPKVWQDLTGEKKLTDKDKEAREQEAARKREAEKPRLVVDVYRGDKHVQELFK